MSDAIERKAQDVDAAAIAAVVAAARRGDAEAIEWLNTHKVDQSWRIDPANDHRQPEVAKRLAELAKRFGDD